MRYYVSRGGFAVAVDTAIDDVRRLLERELGGFFVIGEGQPAAPVVATVHAERARGGRATEGGRPLLLHDGSHDYDLRRGVDHRDARGVGEVASFDTGTVYDIDPEGLHIRVRNPDPRVLAVDVRRTVRDQLYVPWWEATGGVTYHAAAFAVGGRGYLAPGGRGSGKTSVFLAALLAGVSAGDVAVLTCERVIARPLGASLVAEPCPENVSCFPGTLRSLEQTRTLAPPYDDEREWVREGKVRVPWQSLFRAFDARAGAGFDLTLDTVVFPVFDPAVEGVEPEALTPEEATQHLAENQVTLTDVNRPNWLGWFAVAGTAATGRRLAQMESRRLRWSRIDSLADWLVQV